MTLEIHVLEDLSHQLRGSLSAAITRLNSVLEDFRETDNVYQLMAVRGLCRKAYRAAACAGLFGFFSSKNPINLKYVKFSKDDLIKLLIEITADNMILLDPARKIKMHVDKKSFRYIPDGCLGVDAFLFEHAISCLLDNAVKYSYANSEVHIRGGFTRQRKIHITVVNVGIGFKKDEIPMCIERGWRGEEAKFVTAEGSGLGLWLVHNIMRAHDGVLHIEHSDRKRLTEISLIFNSYIG